MAKLSPEQIRQMRKDLSEINKIYAKLGKSKIEVDFAGDLNVDDFKLLTQYLNEAKVAALDLEDGFGGIAESIKNITREWKPGFADPVKEATKSMSRLKSLAEKLSDDVNRIVRLNEKQLEQAEQQAKQEKARLEAIQRELEGKKKLTEEEEALLANLKSEFKIQEDILDKIQARRKEEKEITKLTGMTGKALDGASGILKKIGINIGSDTFKKLNEGARDYAEELKNAKPGEDGYGLDEAQIQAKVMGKTLKDAGKAFKEEILLALDVAIFKGIKDGVKEFGKGREGLSKTFGLGRKDANSLAGNMFRASQAANDVNVSMADNIKSIQEFNDVIGGSIMLTTDQLKMQSLLSDELGLSAKQAANFTKMSLQSGKSAEDLTNDLRGQIKILNMREGGLVNEQAAFAKIGDMSALTKMNLKAQGKSLAEAAFQAQKLGLEMGDMEGTASSLLDFESSIANEMRAELLTGRQLNLEDARRAALMNDEVGLMQAIAREMGTAEEFGQMNFKAQEAFATAIGKSREEVAKILETNELLSGEAKSIAEASEMYNKAMEDGVITDKERLAIGEDALIKQLEAQAAAVRFSKAVEKLKDAFTPVIEAITYVVDGLVDAFSFVGKFETGLETIGKLMAAIAGIRIWARFKAGIAIIQKAFGGLKSITKQVDKVAGAAKDTTAAAAKSGGGGMLGGIKSFFGGVGDKISKGFSSAKNFVASKIPNPIKALKDVFGKGNFLKTLGKFGKRIPVIGAFLESIFAAGDINAAMASGASKGEIDQMVGRRVISGLGAVVGSAGGAALGSALGPVGTVLGGLGGDFVGRWLGGFLADNMSGMTGAIGNFVTSKFGPEAEMATGGIVTGPTRALVGEAGAEAVIPLNEFYAKLDELIAAVKQGQIITMDGNKVGKSLALSTSNLG